MRLNYIGNSDIREVLRADMIARGLSDPGRDLRWTRANSYELDVPNDVGAFLLSFGDFATDSELSFGENLIDAFGGRLLGVAELQWAQTTTAAGGSPATIFGAQVEIEATGKPIRVSWDGPSQNSTAGQGVQFFLYETIDEVATLIYTMFPFRGSSATGGAIQDANLAIALSMSRIRIPKRGLVVYNMKFARFTSGTGAVGAAPTLPATLSVTEL